MKENSWNVRNRGGGGGPRRGGSRGNQGGSQRGYFKNGDRRHQNTRQHDDYNDFPPLDSSPSDTSVTEHRNMTFVNSEQKYDEDAWVEEPAEAYTPRQTNDRYGDSRESNNFGGARRGGGGGGGYQRSDRGERENNWRQRDNNKASVEITVSSRDVGKIIGKGGSKIRELQDNSGARIKIGEQGGDDTIVALIGDEAATSKAKELIENYLYSQNYERNSFQSDSSTDVSASRQKIDWGAALTMCDTYQKERWAGAFEVRKNFYIEDPEVACLHPESVSKFRKDNNNIKVMHMDGDDLRPIPNPVSTFEQAFSHYPEILETVAQQNFEKPSPIQCQAWPIVLQGIDLIGIAQTGTGKTIAFLLPALIHIDNQPVPRSERGGPNVLILAPTRELALQIEKEAKKYKYKGINSVCIYGGGSRQDQVNIVTKGVEIVIATPGRLNDLVAAKIIDVSNITMLILDEADRMLDMGFEPQIRKILLDIRPDRHTIMTSATWPESVRRLATSYMANPMLVFVGTLDLAAVHSVKQHVYIIEQEEKRDFLYGFLQNMDADSKVIVFVGKKAITDDLASELMLRNIPCQSIHGDREQRDRVQALDDLESGEVRILIATDVASRGIDIKDITHIFNFDFPRNIEEYVHRVGRTGRAGRTGESITLMTRSDWGSAKELIEILNEAGQDVPGELLSMAERREAWQEKRESERGQVRDSYSREGFDAGFMGGGMGGRGGRRGRGQRRERW